MHSWLVKGWHVGCSLTNPRGLGGFLETSTPKFSCRHRYSGYYWMELVWCSVPPRNLDLPQRKKRDTSSRKEEEADSRWTCLKGKSEETRAPIVGDVS